MNDVNIALIPILEDEVVIAKIWIESNDATFDDFVNLMFKKSKNVNFNRHDVIKKSVEYYFDGNSLYIQDWIDGIPIVSINLKNLRTNKTGIDYIKDVFDRLVYNILKCSDIKINIKRIN